MLTSAIIVIAAAGCGALTIATLAYISMAKIGEALFRAMGRAAGQGSDEDDFEIETRSISAEEALAALMDGAAHVDMAALEALARGNDPVEPTEVYVTYPDEIVIEG